MTDLNNLGDHTEGTLISESQATKATISNSLDNLLSDATQLPLDITITANRTLTDDEFFGHIIFDLSGSPASDFSLFLPATGEHWFIVRNNTGKVCTVDAGVSAGTVVALNESLSGLFHSDGTSVISTSDPDIMRYGVVGVDEATDYFLFWDDSAGLLRRVLGEDLPGGGGSGTGAFPFRGALASKSADETGADYTTAAVVPWTAEVYDTDTLHDNSTNNSRMTVPPGVTEIKLHCQLYIGLTTADKRHILKIRKNGSLFLGGPQQHSINTSTEIYFGRSSPILQVAPGDYFEVELTIQDDASVTIFSSFSYFAMEIVASTGTGQTATVQTTDATQTVLASGAMAADSAHTIRAYGQGREDATGDTYHFELFGGARNEGGTSSAASVVTGPLVRETADAGAATWDATLEANDTSDEWEIKVTGEAAHTIDWTVTYFEIVQEV